MKRILVVAILFAIATAGAVAQAPAAVAPAPAATPTVDQILDKYVAALGGAEAIKKITSRVSTGTFEIPDQGASGTFESFSKAPNKNGFTVDIAGFGLVRQGFNGTAGWNDNPQAGMRDIAGDELANLKRSADFYGALNIRTTYPKLTVKDKAKFGGRDAWLVEADPGDGKVRKMYFDVETGLLDGISAEVDSPMGKVTVDTFLSDYKEVDGVKVPFANRQENPNFSRIIKLTEVKHNVPVDDARFEKPKP